MNTVITISRQLGSRGSYVAARLAQELDLRYLDREILQRAAEIAGGDRESLIREMEARETTPRLITRIIEAMAAMPAIPLVPSAGLREPYIYSEAAAHYPPEISALESNSLYLELVKQVIREFAEQGRALIVGRGGQVILKEHPHVLRILIVAPEKDRILTLAAQTQSGPKEAERRIRQSDRDRAHYMHHYFGVNWLDPLLYDLIINTGKIEAERAISLICDLVAGHQNIGQ